MDRDLNVLLCERRTDGARLFLSHANATPEGVLEAVKSHLFDVGGGLLGVLVARRIKTLRIPARSEFDHTVFLFFVPLHTRYALHALCSAAQACNIALKLRL